MKITGPIELIKKSVQIFFEKKNLIYFLKIYSPLIPFAVISAIQNYLNTSNYPLVSWVSGMLLFIGVASLIVYFWVGLAGIYAISGVYSGNILSIKGVYEAAWHSLWKFSLLSILLFLILLGGTLLLIIPGIIFGIWYSFSKFAFVDGSGIKDSLTRSKRLVVGKFWKIFGRLIVFGLFAALAQILIGSIPYGIGSLIITLFGALFVLPSYLLYRELSI